MSASRDLNPIPVAGGQQCPKCRDMMQRFAHSPSWRPLRGRDFYLFWDRCLPCGHFQNYPKFKRSVVHAETGPTT